MQNKIINEPPEIIIGGRWWEEQEPEELTDRQQELLDKLYTVVKELRDSIIEKE